MPFAVWKQFTVFLARFSPFSEAKTPLRPLKRHSTAFYMLLRIYTHAAIKSPNLGYFCTSLTDNSKRRRRAIAQRGQHLKYQQWTDNQSAVGAQSPRQGRDLDSPQRTPVRAVAGGAQSLKPLRPGGAPRHTQYHAFQIVA